MVLEGWYPLVLIHDGGLQCLTLQLYVFATILRANENLLHFDVTESVK